MSLRRAIELKTRSCWCGKGFFSTVRPPKTHWRDNTLNQICISDTNKESPIGMDLNSEIDRPNGDCSHSKDSQLEHNKLGFQLSEKEFLEHKNELLKWYPFSYWSLEETKFNFIPLWETYSNLENNTVKIDLKNEYQKQFSGEVTIVVLANHKKILFDPVSIDYKALVKSYQPSNEKYLIPRLSNPEEIHDVHIFWDGDSNQFKLLFNSYDAKLLTFPDIQN